MLNEEDVKSETMTSASRLPPGGRGWGHTWL